MSDNSNLKTLVPTFIIHINGSRISAEREAAVKEIEIIEKIGSPSSFTIKVSDISGEWLDSDDIEEGSEIKITLGYKDEVEEIIFGEVTGLTPFFNNSGGTNLRIIGYNKLHRLLRSKKTKAFNDMNDADIIKEIADDAGLKSEIDDIGVDHLFTMQKNQSNYDYIMELANIYHCKVWAEEDTMYFKKFEENSSDDVVLEWGKTLVDFYPNLDTSKLVTEVEVRGWDNEKAEILSGSATIDDIQLKIGNETLGGSKVKEKFGDIKMIYVDENIIDQQTADDLALEIITNNSMNYIKASGRCEGNNKIKAGMVIQINEVGDKFTGGYLVNDVRHVLTVNKGYSTFLNLSRNTI